MDSNHRRRKPADLQSAPVGHLGNLPTQSCPKGSAIKPNTPDGLKSKLGQTEQKVRTTEHNRERKLVPLGLAPIIIKTCQAFRGSLVAFEACLDSGLTILRCLDFATFAVSSTRRGGSFSIRQ